MRRTIPTASRPIRLARARPNYKCGGRVEQTKVDLCGCYLLRTNLNEPDPVKLWQQYIQLVDAEWAFRISKDELELRPIWHHTADRVQGHILVCFIAYAMWKTLSGWMHASGLGEA